MKFTLSKDARLLLLRAFFLIMAMGLVYGVYDNSTFLNRFPFYLLAGIDIIFALIFVHFTYSLPKILSKKRKCLLPTLIVFWVYTTLVSLGSSAFHAHNLGIENVALVAGQSVPMYIASEIAFLAVLPAVAFGFIIWIIKRINS